MLFIIDSDCWCWFWMFDCFVFWCEGVLVLRLFLLLQELFLFCYLLFVVFVVVIVFVSVCSVVLFYVKYVVVSSVVMLVFICDVVSSGVYYEIFVCSWYDINGDGIGDFNGVIVKFDYFQLLGVSGIWLMLINFLFSYYGYDVIDYEVINLQYGIMVDFEYLLVEVYKCGIKVIIDLVINYISNEYLWFCVVQDLYDLYYDWYSWVMFGIDFVVYSVVGDKVWQLLLDG